jgi:hypothetical protein
MRCSYEARITHDRRRPLQLPAELLGQLALLVVDPPFIDQPVWSCYLRTAGALSHGP